MPMCGARTVQHRARRHGAGWQTFLYVNPLEVHPKSLKFNHIYDTLSRSASVGLAALVVRQISPRANLDWSLSLHAA